MDNENNEAESLSDEQLGNQQENGYSFPQFGTGQQLVEGFKGAINTAKNDMKQQNDLNKSSSINPNTSTIPDAKTGTNPKQNNENAGNKKKNGNDNSGPLNRTPKKNGLNKEENLSPLNKGPKKSPLDGDSDKSLLDGKKKDKKESSSEDKKSDSSKDNDDKNKDDKKKSIVSNKDDDEKKGLIGVKITLKIKIFLILALFFLLLLIFLFIFVFPALNVGMHSISDNFICEMGDPLREIDDYDWEVINGYGWNIRTYDSDVFRQRYKLLNREHAYDSEGNPGCTGSTLVENIYTGIIGETENWFYYINDKDDSCDDNTVIVDNKIYVTNFNNGIELKPLEDDKGYEVLSVHPGDVALFKDLGNMGLGKYEIIDHEEAGELPYKTIYGHMKSYVDDFAVSDLVVMEDTLGFVGQTGDPYYDFRHLYFEVQYNEVGINLNNYFGYDNPSARCSDSKAMTVLEIWEEGCGLPNFIGRTLGMKLICNSTYGTPTGEYTSLICGTDTLTAAGPAKGQCAAGVYNYYLSFLPSFDATAWSKFDAIHGNAVDYWINNNALGSNGFKADQNPTAGSIWVSSHSSSYCGSKPCGHVMAILSVDGDNVKVFECNNKRDEVCSYTTYTKSQLANWNGFLGYIHILGDC